MTYEITISYMAKERIVTRVHETITRLHRGQQASSKITFWCDLSNLNSAASLPTIIVVFGAMFGKVQTNEFSTLQVEALAFHNKCYIGNCDRLTFDGQRQTKHILYLNPTRLTFDGVYLLRKYVLAKKTYLPHFLTSKEIYWINVNKYKWY